MIPYYKYFGSAMATAFGKLDDNCYFDELGQEIDGGDEDTKSCAVLVYITAFLVILIGLGATTSLVFAGLKGTKHVLAIVLSVVCLGLSLFQGALPIERAQMHKMRQALAQFSTWPLALARSLPRKQPIRR